jgi:lipid-A-disaccharide synthase
MVQRVMIIAGEASGDLHGAGVVRELKQLNPDADIYGVGGDRMKAEGMDLVFHIRELGFMGFVEVVKHLPFLRVMERTLEQIVRFKRPDVLVLIDYPGFNLRFARIAKTYGVRIVYYISPQVWAWHRSRVKKMRGLIDKMLVIFPFEVDFYRREQIDVEFVGHPLLEVLGSTLDRKAFCAQVRLDPAKPVLALFPGSRRQEIENIFPQMLTAARAAAAATGAQACVGVAPTLSEEYFRRLYRMDGVSTVSGATYELMANADFAVVTSGTATLETACFGTPMVIVYRTSWPTYLIGRALVRVKNIGLVNIVSGRQVVPELIQHRASARTLARTVIGLMRDPEALAKMRNELSVLRGMLGEPGASRRVAQHILGMA